MQGLMSTLPRPFPPQAPTARRQAGAGVGTILFDFCRATVPLSLIAYAAFVCFVFRQPGGFGLEGVVLAIALVGVFAYNGALIVAVAVGASAKSLCLKCAVTVRPRRAMFYAGLITPFVGLLLAWCVGLVFGARQPSGALGLAVVAAIPAGVVTFVLADRRQLPVG